MTTEHQDLNKYVHTLLSKGQGKNQIMTHLRESGHDESIINDYVSEIIKLHYSKQRSQGLTLILAGAIICFLSFLLTITSSYTHSTFSLVLYGMTSVGIIVAFAGFTKVF